MIELNNDFEIRCNKCGTINTVESIKISPFRERNKKGNIVFVFSDGFRCSGCYKGISYKFKVDNDESSEISVQSVSGGTVETIPQFSFSVDNEEKDTRILSRSGNMESSNYERNKRGISLQRVLAYLLDLCKDLDLISDYSVNFAVGMPNHGDKKQFKAPYSIRFKDNTDWILFSTTSLRDRIKQQYWDSYNIKQIDENVTSAYLVYPDELSDDERHNFITRNKKILEGYEYSPLDGLMCQDSFFNCLEDYALKDLTPNQQSDRKGKNFEHRVAATLNNPINLEKWKNNDKDLEGLHFNMYKRILAAFNVDKDTVHSIKSTAEESEIGYLPTGGNVKTDVLTEITFEDGSTRDFTISCKRSSRSSVSVHQYTADGFVQVLDPENSELRRVLIEFQRAGSRDGMSEEDASALERVIQPYIYALCEWAIGGYGGLGDPDKQWAHFILVYDNNTESARIHTTEEYCRRLANDSTRAFNTPFSWTYQGERGSSIQLKSPIYLD